MALKLQLENLQVQSSFLSLKSPLILFQQNHTEAWEKHSGSESLGLQNLSMPLLNFFLKFNKQKIEKFQLAFL